MRILGIDSGGTFTDAIYIGDNGQIKVFKISSTPNNPTDAVIACVERINNNLDEVLHGTTVATNAVLQRKGAKIALITTKGFRDILEIGRQNRLDIYAIKPEKPKPLVNRDYIVEIDERIASDGSIVRDLTDNEINRVISSIERLNVEGIAVSTLFSFLNPTHELRIKEALGKLKLPISISYEVLPEYREYERTSTTVMDVYVKPLISKYISELNNKTGKMSVNTLAIMKSSTGLSTPNGIIKKPVETLVSGLAGGILAAEMAAKLTNTPNLITLDIGGTSTDVAQIYNYKGLIKHNYNIDNLPVNTASVDVITIGAGGGSIARKSGGLFKVGPESQGAYPGPAAYNLGGDKVTVTDVDLVYGILPEELAGGELSLNKDLSKHVIDNLARDLGIEYEHVISGVRTIFHENIAAALRSVSTERGVDAREFTLLAFGGAGPVHAVELAQLLGINQVLIPPYPGIWSAFGLLTADYRYDKSRGILKPTSDLSLDYLKQILDDLKNMAEHDAIDDGIDKSLEMKVIKTVNMRYIGQSFDIEIPIADSMGQIELNFHNKHRELYGFSDENEDTEIVTVRTVLIFHHPDINLPEIKEKNSLSSVGMRTVLDVGEVPVYNKKDLGLGTVLNGPIIIDQDDTTTWIPTNWIMKVDKYGFMHIMNNNMEEND